MRECLRRPKQGLVSGVHWDPPTVTTWRYSELEFKNACGRSTQEQTRNVMGTQRMDVLQREQARLEVFDVAIRIQTQYEVSPEFEKRSLQNKASIGTPQYKERQDENN